MKENTDVEWFDLSRATALMDQAYAVRVTDAFEDTAVVRAYDGIQLVKHCKNVGNTINRS